MKTHCTDSSHHGLGRYCPLQDSDTEWGLENFSVTTFEPKAGSPLRKTATPKVEVPMGHALCGPVYIRGAEPGTALAIHIDPARDMGLDGSVAKQQKGKCCLFGILILFTCVGASSMVIKSRSASHRWQYRLQRARGR